MIKKEANEVFRQWVENPYLCYNSLFLNLPWEATRNVGIYIPLLHKLSKEGFKNADNPTRILQTFFKKHTDIKEPEEQLDLLFRMVQYIERQVLLFDCIEDSAFTQFRKPTLDAVLGQPVQDNWLRHLQNVSIRLVFTAHPTQFYSREAQFVMRELREALRQNNTDSIDTLLQQLALTPFVNREKPSPQDEADNILYYLRYVYYEAFGQLYFSIGRKLNQLPDFNPQLLQLGFWPGGDRDGNPFVTASVTRHVARTLRFTILNCHYEALKKMSRKLTFRTVQADLKSLMQKLRKEVLESGSSLCSRDLLPGLYAIRKELIDSYKSLYLDELDDLIGRVHLFGTHFASLDIRQDSSAHREVMADIVQQVFGLDYLNLSDEEACEVLERDFPVLNPVTFNNPITRDTLENILQIRQIQKENGEIGLHRYIVSNTERLSDILCLPTLFRCCGYTPDEMKMDWVPLFETMKGMAASSGIMEKLYSNEVYKAHLNQRQGRQTIMLGFSDGTKDGGYLKANWEIHKTKINLTSVSRTYGVKVTFFDGRGGPPARGGGKTHRFYAAQGEDIPNDSIQLTIQGQTITSIFGTGSQTKYTLEQLLTAGNPELRRKNKLSEEQAELMEQLAEISFDRYSRLKEHPLFVSYMEEMTTLNYYGETNIGSRPTRRNKDAQLKLQDLRAIPFVGAWSLIRQNVPGYFGLGSALNQFADSFDSIKQLYRDSAFFRSLMQNCVVSLKKTYFPLTAHLKDDAKYGEFWQVLREEYLLTKKWVLELTGEEELMDNEPLSRRSVSMREHIILPLLTIQEYALQKIRENPEDCEVYKKLVVRCMFGNINASRNSA
jgi:phosphoenolpyruvate carboxylase